MTKEQAINTLKLGMQVKIIGITFQIQRKFRKGIVIEIKSRKELNPLVTLELPDKRIMSLDSHWLEIMETHLSEGTAYKQLIEQFTLGCQNGLKTKILKGLFAQILEARQ